MNSTCRRSRLEFELVSTQRRDQMLSLRDVSYVRRYEVRDGKACVLLVTRESNRAEWGRLRNG